MRWSWRGRLADARPWAAAVALATLLASCGDSGPANPEPDPAVAPFVGTWEATDFTVTSAADPEKYIRIVPGGSFTIVVEPSGHYTATLDLEGLPIPAVEFGQATVDGSSIILAPEGGPTAVSSFVFDGPDQVTLEGATEFDINRDGQADEAVALIVLVRD